MSIRMCEHLHCGGLFVLVKQAGIIIAFLVSSIRYERSPHARSLTCCGVSHGL